MKESTGRRKLSQATETDGVDKDHLSPKSSDKDGSKVEPAVSDEEPVEVKCVGEVIKRSNKGKAERRHYAAFEVDNIRYSLEESVLVAPAESGQKPYVAIIKEIKQAKDGTVAITGQWFYRPEESEKKGGGSWTSTDSRELFYSFHRDEVPAESVMHKCVVHFIPPHKKPPVRTKHPGFIVQKVYDTVEKKLWKLTDKDYEDSKQKEIDLLVQKTRDALGELPNIDGDEAALLIDQEEAERTRRHSRRRTIPHLNVNREESGEVAGKSSPGDILIKAEAPSSVIIDTPSSCRTPTAGFPSDIADLLRAKNALTGVTARDRWLEKITSTLKSVFDASEQSDVKVPETDSTAAKADTAMETMEAKSNEPTGSKGDQKLKKEMVDGVIVWPESAIQSASALERFAYEFHESDQHKYNLKMRQLDFNLKRSPCLVRRLLNKELEPGTVFHMTPVELKEGLTAAEKKAREPAELQALQMTDIRCGLCGEREVGVKDIIHVTYGDRYQLECLKCGHSWYASRDSVSSLTTGPSDVVNASPTVGLAPWATSKFEEVEKELISPKPELDKVPGGHETLTTSDSKKEGDEARAQVSHYQEVENSLTEHITLPAHAATHDQAKSEDQDETKAGSETKDQAQVVLSGEKVMDLEKSIEEQKLEISHSTVVSTEVTPSSTTEDKATS